MLLEIFLKFLIKERKGIRKGNLNKIYKLFSFSYFVYIKINYHHIYYINHKILKKKKIE